jgi:DNA-binding IclR family transcriptional regulator
VIGAVMVSADDDLTEDHMRLLEWFDAHPTGSLAVAAQALNLAITDVEVLCADLVDAGTIERTRKQ